MRCSRGSAHTFLPARGGEAAYLSAGAGGGSANLHSAAPADPGVAAGLGLGVRGGGDLRSPADWISHFLLEFLFEFLGDWPWNVEWKDTEAASRIGAEVRD